MEKQRITWTADKYLIQGQAGKLNLFTIAWKIRADDPKWYMRTVLPGFAGRRWKDDDQEELKRKAERILDLWLREINGEGEADED